MCGQKGSQNVRRWRKVAVKSAKRIELSIQKNKQENKFRTAISNGKKLVAQVTSDA